MFEKPTNTGYYSMGLAGYEMWPDPADRDRMMVVYVAPGQENKPRSYRIRYTNGGRAFVAPYGRRVYLDQVLRSDV